MPKIKDTWVDWIMIIVFLIVLFWLVGAFNTCMNAVYTKKLELARAAAFQQPSDAEKKELNRLFKKHGILAAYPGRNGEYYFWRDRRWCKLQ